MGERPEKEQGITYLTSPLLAEYIDIKSKRFLKRQSQVNPPLPLKKILTGAHPASSLPGR